MGKEIGSISWKCGEWHDGWVTEIIESHGDDVFIRYCTNTIAGYMEPMLKVNVAKGRCYFLTERSSEGEISFPEFETKGYICKLNIY
jgi:hypothetical protein